MAGEWIKMRGNLWDDPRVGRIVDMTASKEATVIGALYWLWATADQHTEDGRMPGLSMQQVDRKTGVKGFAAALVDVGWLVDDAQGVVIQHFEEHNGASAKKRAQTAKRVANWKSGNASETLDEDEGNAASVSQPLAREEKKEEIHPPLPTAVAPPKSPRPSRKCPEGFAVTDAMLRWAAAEAPGVPWQTEHAKFADHTFKTAISDWPGAWRNWMRKAQEFAAAKRTVNGSEPAWRTEQRERNEAFLGPAAARKTATVIDLEAHDAATLRLG